MKTNFYVDAFNLYYGSLKGTPDHWLDLDALFRVVFPKNQINRIRYFTAIVEARPPDLRQPAHQQAYLRALQRPPQTFRSTTASTRHARSGSRWRNRRRADRRSRMCSAPRRRAPT
jgi:hypothetical protein